ncbi:glycosyltransferase family 2 protein [Rhizohabitans arisaemae]|uniref:glycosyltransferase family 2 protein n=1 Tax=Rhizohabitans arisaemae TaxID=2720610 RepID=UPI0024B25847|nr:glycosyltransferase family 2 protein [Rhizohabitans arisaemae]
MTGPAPLSTRRRPETATRGTPERTRRTVSVVVCVYTEDRLDDIAAALDSIRVQTHPADELIVVVDHNPALYRRLRREHPDAIVVANREERGLSGGKNTGVATATGEIVAFLDDDAVADPGWLAHLLTGYDDPSTVGVGGLTRPLWARRRPSWFPEEFDWTVGCTYRGMPTGRSPVRNLMGGNASFRREVFAQVGGFRTGIGRGRGKRPLGCEETEFCIRLSQERPGAVLLYEPRAAIGHRIPGERSRFGYFRTRCYAEGLSKAQVTRSVGSADGLSSERAHVVKTLPRGVLRGLAQAVRGDLSGVSRATAIVLGLGFTTAGYAVGRLSRSFRRASTGGDRD